MKCRTKYYRWTASLALLVVLGLSSCGKKNQEAVDNPSTGQTTSESPAGSPGGTASPTTGASTSSTSSTPATAANLGVKPQGTDCPSDAPIKGNISQKRGKIYHDPKYPDYKKVKPEMCFKDATTAEKAGYRKPKAK